MTNFNFLSNPVAENEVNRALATAKTLQNTGGGTSQYCVSRSEGAHTSEQFSRYCVSRSGGTQTKKEQAWYEKEQAERGATLRGCRFNNLGITYVSPRYSLGLTTGWKYVAMIFAVLVMSVANIGTAWGETYTWSFANGSGTISKTTTNFTSTSGDKTLIYDGGDGCAFDGDSGNKYLKMGGKSSYSSEVPSDRFFKFLAPSSSGTVSISYAGTVSNTEISAGSNGSLVWDVITPTANETSTSKIISGLTAGSTYVYISCPADKSYIKSITWTDAALPYERVYYSEIKTCVWETALESGASFTAHNSIVFNGKAGSGWNSYFSNYLTVSSSNGYATATFSPALSLTSNGVDKGRIRVYFSSTGDNKNISLEMNGNSAGSYNEAKAYRTYVAEYTIPDATSNISILKMYQSGNSGIVIFAIEVLTYSSSTWYLPGSWYNNFERANAVKFTGSPLTLTLHLDEHTSYDFKLVKNNGSETWYDNSGGKVITTMRDWSIAGTSGGNNSVLFTGPEGDYTFTLDPGNQTLDIDYPNIHPDDNYMYFENTNVWGTVGAYIYSDDSWEVTSWEGTPSLANSTVEICGHTYHYCVTPRYSDGGTFNNVIFRNLASSGQSSDRSAKKENHGGKWSDNNSATIHEFNLYTITFAGNGNTGGTMDAIEGLCPNSNRALPANTFEKTDNIFQGWKANVDVTINSATVTAGTVIADEATIENITSDITLTAQWAACTGPTINSFTRSGKTDGTYEVNTALGSLTVDASAGNGGTLSYQWYQYDGGAIGSAVVAAGTSTNATYNIPNNAACVERHYYCVVSEEGCSTTRQSDISGALTLTEPVDPCSEPAKLTNEIARFFVPCGLSNATGGSPSAWTVTNENASTEDNTFTTSRFGGSSDNWYKNTTSGLIYGKLTSNDSYIQLKLKSGSFRAGDVVTAYFNRNDATKTGLTLKTQGSSYAITPASTAAEVETSGSYTLVADAIESDGSIKLFRASSSSYVNRIIVTRVPASASVTATLLTPAYMPTGASGVQIGVEITGASTGWYYRVKKGGGYETPDETTYTTTTWTMTSTIGSGTNTYTVELYNGSRTKMAESNAVTVTGETGHPMTIYAGANGTVSPSGLIYANGEHLHPEITATPASGYHFVNWTLSNANATLENANAATTTITNASGACTITANFAADVVGHTVTYNYNGATGGNGTASATGASVTLPSPTRTDYTFDGWYTTAGEKVGNGGATYKPEADITLYARWEEACAGGGGGGSTKIIGFTTATCSEKATSGGERTLSSVTNLTVAHEIHDGGDGDDSLTVNTEAKVAMYYGSNSKVYSRGAYRWIKGLSSLGASNNTVGFSTTVASGYQFTIDSISFGIGASANFTYQIIIY